MPRKYGPRKPSSSYLALNKVATVKDRQQDRRIKKLEKVLKGIETKYVVQSNGGIGVGSSGALNLHINAITQGDTSSSREGLKVTGKSITMRAFLNQDESSPQPTFTRIVIVRDNRQASGASPTWADIFQSNDVLSGMRRVNAGEYSVLYDKTFVMDRMETATVGNGYFGGRSGVSFKAHLKLKGKNKLCRFNSTTAASIEEGGLYMLSISNVSTDTPVFSYDVTYNYTDL